LRGVLKKYPRSTLATVKVEAHRYTVVIKLNESSARCPFFLDTEALLDHWSAHSAVIIFDTSINTFWRVNQPRAELKSWGNFWARTFHSTISLLCKWHYLATGPLPYLINSLNNSHIAGHRTPEVPNAPSPWLDASEQYILSDRPWAAATSSGTTLCKAPLTITMVLTFFNPHCLVSNPHLICMETRFFLENLSRPGHGS